jgi:hypothetical protein
LALICSLALGYGRGKPNPGGRREKAKGLAGHPFGRLKNLATVALWVVSEQEVTDMPKGDVETYHEDGKWHVKVEGESQPESTHETRKEARRAGRALAQERKVEHIIRKKDGTIGQRNSYGHDPRNIPG